MKQSNKIQRSGILFVISSPSGAGKTTLARKLLENFSYILGNNNYLVIGVDLRKNK